MGTIDTARNNGKKGGRPKGTLGSNTKKAQKIRDYILRRLHKDIAPMVDSLIIKVKSGDVPAFRELTDRAMGRPQQALDVTTGGQPLPSVIKIINPNGK